MATTLEPTAILLAAGSAKRFGAQKLLHPVNGKPLYRHTFDTVKSSGFDQVVVVTNHPEIQRAAKTYGFTATPNPKAAEGIATSIHCGIAASEGAPAWAFFVCDQPFLTPASVHKITQAYLTCGKPTLPRFGGTSGNPCIFPAQLKAALLALTGDTGGKAILHSLPPEEVQVIDLPNAMEGQDLDTPADLPT